MKIINTKIPSVLILEPVIWQDERGFFYESYRQDQLRQAGINCIFVQDNHSRSKKGVLRGLHYQIEPQGMDKLVRVIAGEVYDVAVDIRRSSSTFGQWVGEVLSADNKKQIFIPRGFAHGFCVLSAWAEVEYKCSCFYAPRYERGIRWNDPKLDITWPVKKPIISAKDNQFPLFKDQKDIF